MTRIRTSLCAILLGLCVTAKGEVSEHRNWSTTYEVTTTAPRLAIDNIWGSVRVRTGPEGEITVSADERRSAPDQPLFDRSLELLKVDVFSDAAGVSIVVGEPDRWQERNHCRGCRLDVQFEVVVPEDAIVNVGTALDGVVEVSGVRGSVSASNVNGPIRVRASGCGEVDSVNGPVSFDFPIAPNADCSIKTINGDVTVGLPENAGLDIALSAMNGDIVSDFDVEPYALAPRIDYETTDGKARYRIQQSTGLRLAAGGPLFTISSFNGDVRFQKR